MKHIPFGFEEFLITQSKTITVEIANKLMWYHILPMVKVRELLGLAIWASQFSGYRPKWWEFKKNRSGNSQHVFEGLGAVDWTCRFFKYNRDKFLKLIIDNTNYTRMAIYDGFIHCDYKATPSGKREIYVNKFNEDKEKYEWQFLDYAA
jgi:hypothetical protein